MKKPGTLARLLRREFAPSLLGGGGLVAFGLYPLVTLDPAEAPLKAVMYSPVAADRLLLLLAVALLVAGLSALGLTIARARGLDDVPAR